MAGILTQNMAAAVVHRLSTSLKASQTPSCRLAAPRPTRVRPLEARGSTLTGSISFARVSWNAPSQRIRRARQVRASSQAAEAPLSLAQLQALCEEDGVQLVQTFTGPLLRVQVLCQGEMLGEAACVCIPFVGILHIDYIKLYKKAEDIPERLRSVWGVGIILGLACCLHGVEQRCSRAEILAINDDPNMHGKLVNYYKRIGFSPVYEVEGGRLADIPHMLIWGGLGTRMDAQLDKLMLNAGKWVRGRTSKQRERA